MLTENKAKAISLLITGTTKTDIAKMLNISRQTLYEWLKDSEVIEDMKNQREELLQSGSERLASRLNTYLDVLHKLATTSTDKRTQASCAMYLTDRIMGKIQNQATTEDENTSDRVTKEQLEDEFTKFKAIKEN